MTNTTTDIRVSCYLCGDSGYLDAIPLNGLRIIEATVEVRTGKQYICWYCLELERTRRFRLANH